MEGNKTYVGVIEYDQIIEPCGQYFERKITLDAIVHAINGLSKNNIQ